MLYTKRVKKVKIV